MTIDTTPKVRSAIVGTRFGKMHAQGLAAIPDQADLVAICSRTEDHAREFAAEWGAPWYTSDFDALLARDDVDAVHLCVPHDLHEPMAVAALAAGKHVLCEKPIARTRAEAERVIAAARDSGSILMIAHNQRFVEGHWLARELIQRGKLGRVFLASVAYHGFSEVSGFRASCERSGGGMLIDTGVHWIDLLRWVAGEVEEVAAYGGKFVQTNVEGEDTAALLLKFLDGGLGLVSSSWAVRGKSMFEPLKVCGEQGTIRVERDKLTWETRDGVLTTEQLCEQESWIPDEIRRFEGKTGRQSVELCVEHFIDCVREGRQPVVTGEEGVATLDIALAAYEAMKTGKPARVG